MLYCKPDIATTLMPNSWCESFLPNKYVWGKWPVCKRAQQSSFLILQIDVEAPSQPTMKADKSSIEEEKELRLIQDSVMERDSLAQNHSAINGIEGEVSAPKPAAGSNGVANLSNSITTNAFLMEDSSDSEGPLPEIDLGLSSEDESEEET